MAMAMSPLNFGDIKPPIIIMPYFLYGYDDDQLNIWRPQSAA